VLNGDVSRCSLGQVGGGLPTPTFDRAFYGDVVLPPDKPNHLSYIIGPLTPAQEFGARFDSARAIFREGVVGPWTTNMPQLPERRSQQLY
jgi:hypothetical protein